MKTLGALLILTGSTAAIAGVATTPVAYQDVMDNSATDNEVMDDTMTPVESEATPTPEATPDAMTTEEPTTPDEPMTDDGTDTTDDAPPQ